VLSHFPPCDTYNSQADVKEVLKRYTSVFFSCIILHSATANKDRDRSNDSLLLFGNGDGGGGPNRQMLEQLRTIIIIAMISHDNKGRMKDTDGIPKVLFGTPKEMFDNLKTCVDDICVWQGELVRSIYPCYMTDIMY